MGMRRHTAAIWLVVVPMLFSGAAGAAKGPPPMPIDGWRIRFGDDAQTWYRPTEGTLPDGWQRDTALPGTPGALDDGTWSVTDIRTTDDRLVDFHVSIQPPIPTLGLEAGPAMLFTSLGILGGFGGDVGYERLVSVKHVGLPPCTGDPCRFAADVRLDIHRLPGIMRRDGATGGSVLIGLTLVRSFAGGTWLQALDAYSMDENESPNGTVGAPESWVGRAFPSGLYPVATAGRNPDRSPSRWRGDYLADIETYRTTAGDVTQPAPSTPVRVIATFDCDDDTVTANLSTAAGDFVLLAPGVRSRRLDTTVQLPIGTTWRVGPTSEPGSGFTVTDTPLLIVAALGCGNDEGLQITELTVAAVIDLPTPSSAP